MLVLSSLAIFLSAAPTTAQLSGQAEVERYWDCCKPDCSWEGKADFNQPVNTCGNKNELLDDFVLGSGCNGGSAFSCADQSPWAVNDTFSYGYAGVFILQHASDYWCCACYELTFTSGAVEGKKMLVQAHNAAYSIITENRFALAVPGGNTSYAQACASQYDVPNSVFGVEKEGVSSRDDCDNLPKPLRAGCYWRFDWLENEAKLTADYKRVTCPSLLTNTTGCVRYDEDTFKSAAASLGSASVFSTLTVGVSLAMMFDILPWRLPSRTN